MASKTANLIYEPPRPHIPAEKATLTYLLHHLCMRGFTFEDLRVMEMEKLVEEYEKLRRGK